MYQPRVSTCQVNPDMEMKPPLRTKVTPFLFTLYHTSQAASREKTGMVLTESNFAGIME